jgi:AcrR family transcriptional regulator
VTEKLDSQIRRRQIAEAALSIIAERGVAAVTTKRVAQMVGLTPSALYRHYEDKSAILDAVLDLLMASFYGNIREARGESGTTLALLRNILLRNVRFIERYRLIPAIFLSDYIWHENQEFTTKLRCNFNEINAEIASIFADGQDAETIRADIEPQRLAVAFLGLYGLPSMLAIRGMIGLDISAMVDSNWQIFEKGIKL